MKKKHCVVQAQLCRCVMTLEVKGSSFSGIIIRANGTSLNFTPRKFAIVTGLNGNATDYSSVALRVLFKCPTKDCIEVKKPSRKKSVNIVDEHTQKRTPAPRAAKVVGMKMPVFKPIQTRHATSSKTKKVKQKQGLFFLSPNVDQNLGENQDGTKGKSAIPMMHFGVETVEDKNGFYAMGFPDQSWTHSQIDVCFYYLRKKSKYDPNRFYKFSRVDCNFMNIIRSIHNVYSVDDSNLAVGGQERYIFLYDSYGSSGHYPAVLAEIEKLAEIIPLCLQACDFYNKKGIDLQNHPRYKDKDSSDMFDVLFEKNLPQQLSGNLDCGLYIVTYTGCLFYGHKVLSTEFDPNALHTRYVELLWDYPKTRSKCS
ncbi:hypothetical protein FXO37_11506 [Capsicum annuum]|nr:hypothetical protein FXO37_11506 [Capsicum annuum]